MYDHKDEFHDKEIVERIKGKKYHRHKLEDKEYVEMLKEKE